MRHRIKSCRISPITIYKSGSVSVTIAPGTGALFSYQTLQFNATVYNSSNQGVTWANSSGTVSSNGLYTAPLVSSGTWTYRVWATSNADSTKTATAFVVVTPLVVSLQITTTSLPEVMAGSGLFGNAGRDGWNFSVSLEAYERNLAARTVLIGKHGA